MRIASLPCTSKSIFSHFVYFSIFLTFTIMSIFQRFWLLSIFQFCPNFSIFFSEMDVWPVNFHVAGRRISQFPLDFITGGFLFTQPNQTTSLSFNREPHFIVIFFLLSIVHYDILFPSYKEKNGIIFTKIYLINHHVFLNIYFFPFLQLHMWFFFLFRLFLQFCQFCNFF